MSWLIALVILAFFIVFHELGHFLVARACGVKVEVFSLGFGKRLLSFEYKGTLYAISAIPLGGYVSGFNLLLGFLLYVCVYLYGVMSVPPIVGEVLDSMPAQEAGILPGDRILEINGAEIHTWEELSKLVRDSIGAISMRAQRGESQLDFTLMPRLVDSKTANVFGEFIKHNAIGITAAHQTQIVRYTGFHAITKAWEKTIESSKLILQSLQKLISGAIGVQNISSVVGITHTMASFAQSDLVALLALSALISINLGIFNLLPIPPLDGGHILFTLYQSLTRKKPSERITSAIMIAGLALLLGIMSLGVYNDINHIIAP